MFPAGGRVAARPETARQPGTGTVAGRSIDASGGSLTARAVLRITRKARVFIGVSSLLRPLWSPLYQRHMKYGGQR